MKRRTFFKRAAPALAAPFLFNGMKLRAVARDNSFYEKIALLGQTDRVLVIVQLEGGNDGLNTVIPIEDDAYYGLRPTLSVAKADALRLDGEPLMGLHPTMEGMQRMFDDGLLAIVENIGYQRMNLSHFAGTEIWNTASGSLKETYLNTGWIGRYLQTEFPDYPDVLPTDPPAIEISPATSSIFTVLGASIGMSLTDPDEFYQLVSAAPSVDDEIDPGSLAGREWEFIDSINRQSRTFADSVRTAYDKATNQTEYPTTDFARSLSIVARLIAGGLHTRIYKVSLGNFDTHSYQSTNHPRLLETLSGGIKSFQDDLLALGVAGRVVGMTYSEFGRRPRENGAGTDHGTAAPHFVFGSTVDGGRIFGGLPDLANLDVNGNLSHSIDFHCYYASVVAPLFSIDDTRLAQILPYALCDRPDYVPLYRTSGIDREPTRQDFLSLTIHPNPVDRTASIRIGNGTAYGSRSLSVVDETGRMVMQRKIPSGTAAIDLEVSSLPNGTYLVTIDGVVCRMVVRR